MAPGSVTEFKSLEELQGLLTMLYTTGSPYYREAREKVQSSDPFPAIGLYDPPKRKKGEDLKAYNTKIFATRWAHEQENYAVLAKKDKWAKGLIPVISRYINMPPPSSTAPGPFPKPIPSKKRAAEPTSSGPLDGEPAQKRGKLAGASIVMNPYFSSPRSSYLPDVQARAVRLS